MEVGLSADDEARANLLARDVEAFEAELLAVAERRAHLESQRNALLTELSENLHRHEAQIRDELSAENAVGPDDSLESFVRRLDNARRALDTAVARLGELEASINKETQEANQLQEEMERARTQHESNFADFRRGQQDQETLRKRLEHLQLRKEAIAKKIRELGSVPAEAEAFKKESPRTVRTLFWAYCC